MVVWGRGGAPPPPPGKAEVSSANLCRPLCSRRGAGRERRPLRTKAAGGVRGRAGGPLRPPSLSPSFPPPVPARRGSRAEPPPPAESCARAGAKRAAAVLL